MLGKSNFDEDKVNIKITIETSFFTIEAYDECEESKASDYAYSNLKEILKRPHINEAGNLLRFLFGEIIEHDQNGMFFYPYLRFVDDRWTKRDIKTFEKELRKYGLEGIIEYDFSSQNDVIVCYGDFIRHFVRCEIKSDLPF